VDEALEKQPQVRGSSADGFVGRRLKDLLDEASRQSAEFKDEYVSSEHLLLARESSTPSSAATKRFGAPCRCSPAGPRTIPCLSASLTWAKPPSSKAL